MSFKEWLVISHLRASLSRVENRLKYGLIEDIYSLAASYATAVSQAHCFNDGNKRTAFQVMDLILDLNGINVDLGCRGGGAKNSVTVSVQA